MFDGSAIVLCTNESLRYQCSILFHPYHLHLVPSQTCGSADGIGCNSGAPDPYWKSCSPCMTRVVNPTIRGDVRETSKGIAPERNNARSQTRAVLEDTSCQGR